MMITSRRFTFEQFLFLLAFTLALVLRFIHLGVQPLTDLEARWALQAAEIARGSKPLLGGQPAYLLLTAVNFFVFGASNFMARFWPALAGAGLILVPAAFQKELGRKAAILLAFFLALDPGLLAVSRMAASQMMAVGLTGVCLAAWQLKRYKLAGGLAGVALLCGPAAWFGLSGLSLTWLIIHSTGNRKKRAADQEGGDMVEAVELESVAVPQENQFRTVLKWGAGTLLLVGTLLFLVPNGLSAWAGSIADFITGWGKQGYIPLWFFPVTLLVYAPLALIFGLIGFVRGSMARDQIRFNLGILAGVFLLITLVYPPHKTGDLVWVLVPLWSLAAIELGRYLDPNLARRWEIVLASVITYVFMVFLWLDMISISTSFNNPEVLKSRLLLLLGAFLILVLSMLLLAAIWNDKITGIGLVWGGTIALLLYTVSSGLNASGMRLPFSAELWQPSPQFIQADLLKNTIRELSVWRRGQTKSLTITTTTGLNSPAVLWLLRDWQVEQVDAVPLEASPELVLLPQGVELKNASGYRGQDFILHRTPVWDSLTLDGWLRWISYRNIPERTDLVVLWTRNDLLLDTSVGLDSTTP